MATGNRAEREDLKDGDRELVRQRWRKQVHGRREGVGGGREKKKEQKSQQCGKERDPGESLDAEEGRRGPEGPALTAALALGAAGRLCRFRRFSLLLSSTPLPYLRSLGCPPPKRKRPCLAALTRRGSLGT